MVTIINENKLHGNLVKLLSREFGDDNADGAYHNQVATSAIEAAKKSHRRSLFHLVSGLVEYSYKDAILGRKAAFLFKDHVVDTR